MRTATMRERPQSDVTARARIRDAAIDCFATSGFDASFRTIATRADVSPALITHHFRSKVDLRAACDDEVLRQYTAMKVDGVQRPSGHLLEAMAAPGVSATLLVYMLRAILAGGSTATAFLEHLIEDMRPVMAQGVASGLVRPSRDEEARLRFVTYQSIGALLVQFVTTPAGTPEEFVASLSGGPSEAVLPMLELYTEGLLADRSLLDDFVAQSTPPATPMTTGRTTGRTTRKTTRRSRS